MTSKERVRRAMDGEMPDRVPLMCQMSIGHMLLQTRLELAALWNSAEVLAEGLLQLRQRYGFDGILVSLHGHSPDWENGVSRVEKDLDKQVIHWKNGDRTVFPCDDLPIHYPAKRRSLPVLSEIDPGSIPDEIPFIPVSQNLEFPIDPGHRFDIFDIVMKKAGGEFSVHAEVTSPFDYFLNLLGFREALIGLIENPAKAKEILNRYAEAVTRLAVGIAGQGVDAIKVSSPYAGAGFISPLFYQEFVAPFEGRIAGAVRRRGLPVYIHTCGAVNDRLELMADAGFSGIECLDPPPLGNVDLGEAKERVGERVFIKGNIDPVNVLLLASRESVREDARRRLEVGKPGGRFILSTACSIAPRTPRENVEVLSEVIEREGSY